MFERLEDTEKKYEELTQQLSSPEIVNDSARYQKTAKAHSELRDIVEKYREYKDLKRGISESEAMVKSETDAEMRAYAEEELGQLRGAEASRSCDDLEAFRVGAHGDGLDEAVLPDAFGELLKLGIFKRPARVGGGLVDGVESEELECAAVLHDGPPWAV